MKERAEIVRSGAKETVGKLEGVLLYFIVGLSDNDENGIPAQEFPSSFSLFPGVVLSYIPMSHGL
jgi:hypothetical protein